MASTKGEDVATLDALVDRMRNCIPGQPYIQTIPQDEPRWHHHSWEAAQVWRRDVPFDADERADLQYQTNFYSEHGRDCIHLRIHTPPPEKKRDKQRLQLDGGTSGAGTPGGAGGVKKRISLADYKKEKVTGTKMSTEEKPLTNGASKHMIPEEKVDRRGMQTSSARDFAQPGSAGTKRKRTADDRQPQDSPSPIRRKASHEVNGHRSPVRRKLEKSATSKERDATNSMGARAAAKDHLPPALSPLSHPMPGRLSPLGSILPDRLSPDLPASILEGLERRARQRAESSASKSSGNVLIKHDSANGVAQPSKGEGESRQKGDEPSDGKHAKPAPNQQGREDEHRKKSDSMKQSEKVHKEDSRRPASLVRQLIVRLKIPRQKRQDMIRLLRFPPRPSIRPTRIVDADTPPDTPALEAKANPGNASPRASIAGKSTTSKRPPSPRERSRSKSPSRIKHDKDKTPDRRTPIPPPTSTGKRQASSAMSRISSTDGHIPSPAATPASTVSSTGAAQSLRPPPLPGSRMSNPQADQWTAKAGRLTSMGKNLKTSGANSFGSEPELALMLNIESLCAFMLSFHCSDVANLKCLATAVGSSAHMNGDTPVTHSTINPNKTWATLHKMYKVVFNQAQPWPPLRGLLAGLGLAYLGRILAWAEKNRDTFEAAHDIRDAAAIVMGRILMVEVRLTIRTMRAKFPVTWQKVVDEELEAPITAETGVPEAVRTAMSVLKEWKMRGGGRFEPSLNLDALAL